MLYVDVWIEALMKITECRAFERPFGAFVYDNLLEIVFEKNGGRRGSPAFESSSDSNSPLNGV
jgi:hypothetical protein